MTELGFYLASLTSSFCKPLLAPLLLMKGVFYFKSSGLAKLLDLKPKSAQEVQLQAIG